MLHVLKKIKKTFEKNKLEGLALMMGQMPKFVYGIKRFKDIPVFCFHSAKYPLFEKQLQFLNENGYKTLTADELYERCIDKNYKNNGKEIVITFDDGMASVWTVAYPLLKKYEHKIISFILPGLMREGEGVSATIDDVVSEKEKSDLSNRDFSNKPLCNWSEVKIMHESGLIDFQSHGMNHALISISPKIVDFIHPRFDIYHYGNLNIPMYLNEQGDYSRNKVLGHPVYEHIPRLSAKPAYFDPVELRNILSNYVIEYGGDDFFKDKHWRSKLARLVAKYQNDNANNDYESPHQVENEILNEIKNSKKIMEEKLNKKINHFCFPWFVGSEKSALILKQTGYLSAHVSTSAGFHCSKTFEVPLFIKRVQEEYLMSLPGSGNENLINVFKSKLSKEGCS